VIAPARGDGHSGVPERRLADAGRTVDGTTDRAVPYRVERPKELGNLRIPSDQPVDLHVIVHIAPLR